MHVAAREPVVTNYYHPVSEPAQLYLADFLYGNRSKTYRIYCPTGMVRDISNGGWKKARKAFEEDRIKYGSKRVVRRVFDQICEMGDGGRYANARVAARPILTNYYHPKSEPAQLYIVDFDYGTTHKTYRVYCPTGMVRDISNGGWKKARKAYVEDRVKYGNNRVVREIFEEVCMR
jgi:hypothetical protein